MDVLLGLGGTDESIMALEQTVERAGAVGDELTVAVLEKPESRFSQHEMAEQAAAALEAAGLDADGRILEGDPGSAIVDLAEAAGYAQLVIAGGQESPMGKIRIGPIAEFVLLNASMTVTLVR